MMYNIGDKVLIVDKRVFGMNYEGKMDKYLSTIMTICEIDEFYSGYKMIEDGGEWHWDDDMIVKKVGDGKIMRKRDLKTGMRVQTKDGQIYLVVKDIDTKHYGHQDIGFVNNEGFLCGTDYNDDLTISNIMRKFDIIKVYNIYDSDNSLLNKDTLNLEEKVLIWEREYFPQFPQIGDTYYYPSCDKSNGVESSVWADVTIDRIIKERVGIYETEEQALEKAKELGWI